MTKRVPLSDREATTVLAALRYYQDHYDEAAAHFAQWGYFDEYTELDIDEIDDLCDRINC